MLDALQHALGISLIYIKEVYQFDKLLTTDMNNEGSYVDYFEYMSSSTSITIKTCS